MNNDKLPTVNLSSFSEEKAIKAFGIQPDLDPMPLLGEWMNRAKTVEITGDEQKHLNQLQRKLVIYVRGMNEFELRFKFISQVIELVDYDDFELAVGYFAERPISVIYKGSIIQGIVDGVISRGQFEPDVPFFFIHEYKREKDASGDPVGQLLATMYASRLLRDKPVQSALFQSNYDMPENMPLYGCYILGRLWFFARLEGDRYAISKAYDSTDEQELKEIFKIMKAQKDMIFELVQSTVLV